MLGLVSGVGFTIFWGQDFGVPLHSTTWSSSADSGTNPAASKTTSAPGCIMNLLVLWHLLLSILTEIRTALDLAGWSMGEKFFTGGLMTPPEFDNDLARFTIGTGGLGVWIGVLVLETLGAILQNFPWKGTAGAARFVDADSCLGCTCAFGSIGSSDEEDDEIFLCVFNLFRLLACWVLVDLKLGNYFTLMKGHFS